MDSFHLCRWHVTSFHLYSLTQHTDCKIYSYSQLCTAKCLQQGNGWYPAYIVRWQYFTQNYSYNNILMLINEDAKLNGSNIQDLHLNLIKAFLKSIHDWCTASLYSNFFSNIWRMHNIWSIVDLLRWNPHWLYTAISSTFGVKLDRKMQDKIS